MTQNPAGTPAGASGDSVRVPRVRPDFGNLLAVAISLFALAIGAYQTRLMQKQARASV